MEFDTLRRTVDTDISAHTHLQTQISQNLDDRSILNINAHDKRVWRGRA
jgi:hypothetical protein